MQSNKLGWALSKQPKKYNPDIINLRVDSKAMKREDRDKKPVSNIIYQLLKINKKHKKQNVEECNPDNIMQQPKTKTKTKTKEDNIKTVEVNQQTTPKKIKFANIIATDLTFSSHWGLSHNYSNK